MGRMSTMSLSPGPGALRSEPIKGLLAEELEALALRESAPRHAAKQLLGWMYRRLTSSFAEMTDLRRSFRDRLEASYRLSEACVLGELTSADGVTKLLIGLTDGERVETVIIPERQRTTLCVSTQAGCARGCAFCATGRVKFRRNLSAGEILEQVVIARRRAPVTNVVFMGMGEPLDNFENVRRAILLLTSPAAFGLGRRHVTLSTAGVVPGIERLAREGVPARLTVSLNAPRDKLRSRLMPVNRTWPLAKLQQACREHIDALGLGVTFAYVLLKDINDSPACARELAILCSRLSLRSGSPAKVNLIAGNPATGFSPPGPERINRFQEALRERGVLALFRRGRGEDISAACGQLTAGNEN